ncbi:hypothetical protein OH773_22345 (plasmid) [Buttiauxella sp. WJP83]|uniref:hypothetical protein n=1 Tax=Buttiauxella sp. WJP83 TaxID=2986951 RepID=UPI0022DD27C1|nr:hypothetical protein [Buttiauxella sp. WJP83]WBM72984.1 hypothetical protein OH773_22345 [Buttiauxella sp. WJP83]
MQIKKVFPIYEGANLRRRWATEAEWRDWLRAHGAYGFRVAPYYNRCCIVFGERRYVETVKQLYGLDESEFVNGVGGMVTSLGYVTADSLVHCVYLPETYEESIYWHEALHVALMTAEYHGILMADQEALTYLQGYIAEEFSRARLQFLADKKAGGLPKIEEIVTRPSSTISRGGYCNRKVVMR